MSAIILHLQVVAHMIAVLRPAPWPVVSRCGRPRRGGGEGRPDLSATNTGASVAGVVYSLWHWAAWRKPKKNDKVFTNARKNVTFLLHWRTWNLTFKNMDRSVGQTEGRRSKNGLVQSGRSYAHIRRCRSNNRSFWCIFTFKHPITRHVPWKKIKVQDPQGPASSIQFRILGSQGPMSSIHFRILGFQGPTSSILFRIQGSQGPTSGIHSRILGSQGPMTSINFRIQSPQGPTT